MTSSTHNNVKLLVISLPEAADRRQHAARQLAETGLDWEFFDAISGAGLRALPAEYDAKKRLRFTGYPMSPAEIACFLSHRAVWRKCAELDRPVLVLEDDFVFVMPIGSILEHSQRILSIGDVAKFEGRKVGRYRRIEDLGIVEVVRYRRYPLGAGAYLLNPRTAGILLEKSRSFFVPVDDFLWRGWDHHLRFVDLRPYPVKISGAISTIPDRNKPPLSLLTRLRMDIYRIPDKFRKRVFELRSFYRRH